MNSSRRPYRRRHERRVWVFSDLRPDLRPHDSVRVLARAALEASAEAQVATTAPAIAPTRPSGGGAA